MNRIPANVKRTKPHIMVLGNPDDETRKYLSELGTGVNFLEREDELLQDHFSVVLCFNPNQQLFLNGAAPVLHFSGMGESDQYETIAQYGRYEYWEHGAEQFGYRYSINRVPGSKAVDFDVMEGHTDPADLYRLASDTIFAKLFQGVRHSVLDVSTDPDLNNSKATVVPLVHEEGQHVNAAILHFTECEPFWSLPSETVNHVEWVKLFLDVMKRKRPNDFPEDEVELSKEYWTPAEIAASIEIVEYDAETERLAEQRKQQASALAAQLVQATRDADDGDRKLLTTQGKELEHWVAETLTAFGFDVEDMDKDAAKHNVNKREDFRLTIPGEPGEVGDGQRWVCLVEVKGRTGGAKVTDLGQIRSAADIFLGKYDHEPSARWYVVNAELNKPAQNRQKPLKSSSEDVRKFAKDGGLVLDTRDLFKLKRQVDEQRITPAQARTALVEQTGWFELPDTAAQ